MSLRFTNTYTRALEEFRPLDPPRVRMYTCGPTVYNYAHIGNFRAYMFEDLLQRHLEHRGYQVDRVMNLTDVDDKTIRNSREAGLALEDFTAKYKKSFFEDLKTLRIRRDIRFPAATEPQFIERMIDMIGALVEGGFAYQAEDGSVYYRLSRFPAYGRLAHLNLEELRPSGRVRSDEYEKEHIGDFALWKAWDEADGDVAWDSPWGRGRPGWHIECSAMATALLGPELDIHCGAVDNIFPHHEAEIAQSEACTGKTFVRYWLHCAHLIVDGQKMSKSLGNFYTLRDLLAKGYSGREIRFVLIGVNYRLPLNFTFEGLNSARSSLSRIDEWLDRLRRLAGGEAPSTFALADQEAFAAALDDDLNISGALGHLFDTIRKTNASMDQDELLPADAAAVLRWWESINAILDLERGEEAIPVEVQALLDERGKARAAKDWAASDTLRDRIAGLGWVVKDTRDGQVVKRKT